MVYLLAVKSTPRTGSSSPKGATRSSLPSFCRRGFNTSSLFIKNFSKFSLSALAASLYLIFKKLFYYKSRPLLISPPPHYFSGLSLMVMSCKVLSGKIIAEPLTRHSGRNASGWRSETNRTFPGSILSLTACDTPFVLDGFPVQRS